MISTCAINLPNCPRTIRQSVSVHSSADFLTSIYQCISNINGDECVERVVNYSNSVCQWVKSVRCTGASCLPSGSSRIRSLSCFRYFDFRLTPAHTHYTHTSSINHNNDTASWTNPHHRTTGIAPIKGQYLPIYLDRVQGLMVCCALLC